MNMPFMTSWEPRSRGASSPFDLLDLVLYTRWLRPSIAGLRKQWCPEIVDLMEKMWAQDPRDRPTMTEVMNRLRELVAEY